MVRYGIALTVALQRLVLRFSIRRGRGASVHSTLPRDCLGFNRRDTALEWYGKAVFNLVLSRRAAAVAAGGAAVDREP
jgi:hypothetical protein